MLKKLSSLIILLSTVALLTGMGGKGGGFERVPRVDKNYAVVVTDITGTRIEGDKFSWEGRTRFSGYMGAAEVNVPFEKVKDITVGERRDRKVRVTINLLDGGSTTLEIDADSHCYGESAFGSFMLAMTEMKSVSFRK